MGLDRISTEWAGKLLERFRRKLKKIVIEKGLIGWAAEKHCR